MTNTTSEEFQGRKGSVPRNNAVHEVAFKTAFGEDYRTDVLCKGFTVKNGTFTWNSGAFNKNGTMSETSKGYVEKFLSSVWIRGESIVPTASPLLPGM
mmetsp:Transcript_31678/g.43460  ORF Transcript_31678/g.43460 Transcript_31678/m.43460 type:complete len:98 (+) Transcript_31678:427-720(+)